MGVGKLCLLFSLAACFYACYGAPYYPVVLIPGLLGSSLEGIRRQGSWVPLCPTTTEWSPMWPWVEDEWDLTCWAFDITVQQKNGKFVNYTDHGMEVRPSWFGSVKGMEVIEFQPYYSYAVKRLEDAGYGDTASMFGAPFDWRLTPQSLNYTFQNFTQLIENAYNTNGRRPVVVVAHSYGNMIFTFFLNNNVTAEWKAKYIKHYFAISGPFLGSAESIASAAFGLQLDFYVPKSDEVTATFPSMYYLMPSAIVPNLTTPLFQVYNYCRWDSPWYLCNKDTYYATFADYKRLLDRVIYPKIGWDEFRVWINEQFDPTTPPGVPVSCLYGTGVKTAYGYNVTVDATGNWLTPFSGGYGDGTVVEQSGSYCSTWSSTIYSQGFPGATHLDILQEPALLDYIIKVATTP